MTKIAVIILNWNGKEDSIACIDSIKRQHIKNTSFQIIVVDNNSNDNSVEEIKNKFPSTTILSNKKNIGFAEGNNVGIRYAMERDFDYIVILNNDTIVNNKLLQELIAGFENNNKIGIVVPKILFAKGFEYHKENYTSSEKGKVIWYAGGIIDWRNVMGYHRGVDEVDRGQYDKAEETDYATGCCFMIRRTVLEKVGLFDARFFLYYEDNDLSMRVKKAGFSIYYAPKALLWHKNAGSAGGSGSALQDYYITRNRLLFGIKHAPLRAKVSLLKESIWLLKNGRVWQKKGIWDFYLQRFGKGSYSL